jgi:hypothetical protein
MKKINHLLASRVKAFLLVSFVLSGFVLIGTGSKEKVKLNFVFPAEPVAEIRYPDVSFAVISDTHIYDPSLGTAGKAFEAVMNSDRKLLLDSIDLLDYAIKTIMASNARFVLISGDLTKDGELINHRLIAEKLKVFRNAGIGVYVIPGNHDVNNPGAESYSGDSTTPVPTISPEEYAQIYGNYGYNAAVMRDNNSLSYVAEPAEGLWLLAIDDCRYRENVPGKEEIVSGKISQNTADWIAAVLQEANRKNKAVMGMMHHGIVEHWKGQAKLHPDYLIAGYQDFGRFLASWNVKIAFTGHYHAQDITRGNFGDRFLYDIETGSLITAPCPIRFVEIKNNAVSIRSETIAEKIHPGTNFSDNARAFVKRTVMLEAVKTLRKYKVSINSAEYIADKIGDAFDAHYAGDENPALRPDFDKSRLGLWGKFVYSRQKYVFDGLWADLPPADNNVSFNLSEK